MPLIWNIPVLSFSCYRSNSSIACTIMWITLHLNKETLLCNLHKHGFDWQTGESTQEVNGDWLTDWLTERSPLSWASTHTCLVNWKQARSQTLTGISEWWGPRGQNCLSKNRKNVCRSLRFAACSPEGLVIFVTLHVCSEQSRYLCFKSSQPVEVPEGWFDREAEFVISSRSAGCTDSDDAARCWFQEKKQAHEDYNTW